jgi:methyl-accepting chemotaxis protein
VERAGETMEQIVASVQQVTDMGEISPPATNRAGIEEVNKAIAQMDQVTQQNAALVEQAAAAVGSLQDQALQLAQAVGVFQLARSRLAAALSATQEVPAAPATPVLALVPPAASRLADVREHAHG